MFSPELVVLTDEAGHAIGAAPKAEVHTTETPLHLAFSCHVLDAEGRVLVTRRALAKKTWPGVWTNSFCGHPAPGEDAEEAITRRAAMRGATVAMAWSNQVADITGPRARSPQARPPAAVGRRLQSRARWCGFAPAGPRPSHSPRTCHHS